MLTPRIFRDKISYMEKLAERLRALRKDSGLSPGGLAEKLGVTAATISRWESGKMAITDQNLVKIARFFEVSADFLLGLDAEPAPSEVPKMIATKTLKALTVITKRIDGKRMYGVSKPS